MSAVSIRELQRKIYHGHDGPPILPHGDDLEAQAERRRAKRRRKRSRVEGAASSALGRDPVRGGISAATPLPANGVATSSHTAHLATQKGLKEPPKQQQQQEQTNVGNPHDGNNLWNERFPASHLPAGFPPELAFRALAAYATVRTLSLKLRLSPCTANVFLRALYLPVPTRLLGHVHVALLRLLFPHLQQHYHWGSAVVGHHHGASLRRFPWLPHTKKRKLDGLRWTLRAGDDLEYLDIFTWPLFFDDYAHLTADQLHWSATGPPLDELNRNVDDPRENPEVWKNLDTSSVPPDWVDPLENMEKEQSSSSVVPSLSVLYLNDLGGGKGNDSDDEEVVRPPAEEEDEDFDLEAAVAQEAAETVPEGQPRKRKRGRPRKSHSVSPTRRPAKKATTLLAASSEPIIRDGKLSPPNGVMRTASVSSVQLGRPSQGTFTSTPSPAAPLTAMHPLAGTESTTNEQSTPPMPGTSAEAADSTAPSSPSPSSFLDVSSEDVQSTNTQRSMLQHVSSNYWSQQQLQSKLKSARTASGVATAKFPVVPSMQDQNHVSQQCVASTNLPVAVESTNHGTSKNQSEADPGDVTSASLLEAYTHITNQLDTLPNVNNSQNVSKDEEKDDQSLESVENGVPSEPPFVWAHFDALQELRSGKAYHELSVERKLDILEYLIDEVLMLDMVASEMTFRFNAKERYERPYGNLPTKDELENLENDDQCAVCLGEGDLLCCDGCPSSYHQACIGLTPDATLPDGKWYCPECVLVDPAKFGPLNEATKSSVDWFRLRDVCRSQEHLLSTAESSVTPPTEAMIEEKEYMVIHGFVFCRSTNDDSSLVPGEAPPCPTPLSTEELGDFLFKVGKDDRGRWPLAQIPSTDFPCPACPAYLAGGPSFDPNHVSNEYRLVPPLYAPKRLQLTLLKTVEDVCGRISTFHVSERLSKSMRSDAQVVEMQKSSNPLLSEYLIASNYAREIHQKILKALLFRPSAYIWATESFLPVLSKAKSIHSVSAALVALVDAFHPRAFRSEWFDSPSLKSSPEMNVRTKSATVSLCEDSTPSKEVLRRNWQCMQAGNVICFLSKSKMSFDSWIASVRPDLATSISHKTSRKRENKIVKRSEKMRGMVGFNSPHVKGASKAMVITKPSLPENDDDDGDGYHFRNRHEKPDGSESPNLEEKVGIDSHIVKEQENLIDFLLDLPGEVIGEPVWPVAGRRLFEPIGELPRQDIRRLARRAGSVKAPFVLYSQTYEVGQAPCYHIWRKQMMLYNSFEELLLGMHTLAHFLDTDTIRQATTAARKKKVQPNSSIYCSCVDMSSGEEQYLVLPKTTSSGMWVSSRGVDVKALVSYQSRVIDEVKSKRKEQLKTREIIKKKKDGLTRKGQSKSNSAKNTLSANIAQPVGPIPEMQQAPSPGNATSISNRLDAIVRCHNENILQLLCIHWKTMGPHFIKSRAQARSSTIALLRQKVFKNLGLSATPEQIKVFLATHEKAFLEKIPNIRPAMKYLYPPGDLAGAPLSIVTGTPKSYSSVEQDNVADARWFTSSADGSQMRQGNFQPPSAPAVKSPETMSRGKGGRPDPNEMPAMSTDRVNCRSNVNPRVDRRPIQQGGSSVRDYAVGKQTRSMDIPAQRFASSVGMTCPPNVDPQRWDRYMARRQASATPNATTHFGHSDVGRIHQNQQDSSRMQLVQGKNGVKHFAPGIAFPGRTDIMNWRVNQTGLPSASGQQSFSNSYGSSQSGSLQYPQHNHGGLPHLGQDHLSHAVETRHSHSPGSNISRKPGRAFTQFPEYSRHATQMYHQGRDDAGRVGMSLASNKTTANRYNSNRNFDDARANRYPSSSSSTSGNLFTSQSTGVSREYQPTPENGLNRDMLGSLFAGIEPIPVGDVPYPQFQSDVGQSQSTDNSAMLDLDFLSPTPIHPDHHLNRTQRHSGHAAPSQLQPQPVPLPPPLPQQYQQLQLQQNNRHVGVQYHQPSGGNPHSLARYAGQARRGNLGGLGPQQTHTRANPPSLQGFDAQRFFHHPKGT